MNPDSERVVLTTIWFTGMIACLAVVVSYMVTTNASGVPLLVWTDVALVLRSVLAIYSAYLGGIIVFWFTKPFKLQERGARDHIRFWIALTGAVIVNGAYIAGLAIGYWNPAARLEDIVDARNLVLWLSFIVAPANIYFFGVRKVLS